LIEYKCSGCGLVLYRVYAEGLKRSSRRRLVYELYEELFDASNNTYVRRRCNGVLSPGAIAALYEKCPKCGKPLEPPSTSNYKGRVVVG
jgi:DNA-directed RNA polymerase subunit RPC12/RpoP